MLVTTLCFVGYSTAKKITLLSKSSVLTVKEIFCFAFTYSYCNIRERI
jgi:hypothetical protein